MKTHRPTTHRRKRRAADEAAAPAERAEALSPAQSLATLRQPNVSGATRGTALVGLGRAVGNAQVAREMGGDLQRVAEQIQRKGAKKAPGTTTIHAPRQATYAVEAHTLDEAAQ